MRQLDINKRGFVWGNNNIINLSDSRSLIKIKTRHIQKRGDIITGKPDAINRMDMKRSKSVKSRASTVCAILRVLPCRHHNEETIKMEQEMTQEQNLTEVKKLGKK